MDALAMVERVAHSDLMTCIDCNQAMKIEKIVPEGGAKAVPG